MSQEELLAGYIKLQIKCMKYEEYKARNNYSLQRFFRGKIEAYKDILDCLNYTQFYNGTNGTEQPR